MHRQADADPDKYFFSDQYANENNWQAHFYTTAAEILDQTDRRITHFVGGVGTGGSITGVGRRLKEESSDIEVTMILPDAFPGIEGLKPMESEEDIIPEIFDDSVVDRRINVDVEEAYTMCQRLAKIGFFVGQSSGAYLAGVQDVVSRIDRGVVVTIFNDLGERYFSTGLWGRD